jgi:peptidoglycan/xylan/chitin deacetylase (PgdA/CDA1 family)
MMRICLILCSLWLLAVFPGASASRAAPAADPAPEYARARPSAWGVALAGIQSRLPASKSFALALTLDACDGGYDAELIAWLRNQGIAATLFVTSIWIRRHPDAFRDLAAEPLFEIAAHGERHRPASVTGRGAHGIRGTGSVAELVREVEDNAERIRALTGRRPGWFRSGTTFYDDVAVRVIQNLGLNLAGYSLAGDEGATLSARRVEARLLAAKPGEIILCHMNRPKSGTRDGLKAALPRLRDKGARFVRLSEAFPTH